MPWVRKLKYYKGSPLEIYSTSTSVLSFALSTISFIQLSMMAASLWYYHSPPHDSHRRTSAHPLQVQTKSIGEQWTRSTYPPLTTPALSPSYIYSPNTNDGSTYSYPSTPSVNGGQNYYGTSDAYFPVYPYAQSPRQMPSPQYAEDMRSESFSQESNGPQELFEQSRLCLPTIYMPEPQIMISSPPLDQQYSQQHQGNGYEPTYNQTPSPNALSPEDARQFTPWYPHDNYPQFGFPQQSPRSWGRRRSVNRSYSRSNCRRSPSPSPRRSPSPSFHPSNPAYPSLFPAWPQPSSALSSALVWGTDESQPPFHAAPNPYQINDNHVFESFSLSNKNNNPAGTTEVPNDVPRGQKKALLIGINYLESVRSTKLKGCINDAKFMKKLLMDYGYQEEDIVTLVDDSKDRNFHPTHDNIIREMKGLVGNAKSGDYLFFHYSGHGDQITDTSGDELSGKDQRIIPSDYYLGENKYIVDDELHEILVGSLPAGCRLTAVFDACHSGTALDLPYMYSKNESGNPKGVHETTFSANVISWSACQDEEQGSDDVNSDGEDVGAMCSVFIECLKHTTPLTYENLYSSLGDKLKIRNPQQHPQLGSSHLIYKGQIFEF